VSETWEEYRDRKLAECEERFLADFAPLAEAPEMVPAKLHGEE